MRACIIQLNREPIGLSIKLTKFGTVSEKRSETSKRIKSPARAGFDSGGGTAKWSEVFGRGVSQGRKRSGTDADSDEGQANKSARGMPWHQEPMKDVISCDKLRGAANKH